MRQPQCPAARRAQGAGNRGTFTARPLYVVTFALSLWLLPHASLAEPVVRVRAESRLELMASVSGDQIEVKGVLRDDQGSGLGQQPIAVHLIPNGVTHDDPARQSTLLDDPSSLRRTRTDPSGTFAVRLKQPPHGYELEARFEGNPYQTPAVVRRPAPGPTADLALDLLVADRALDLGAPSQSIIVEARGAGPLEQIPLRIENELGAVLAEGASDAEGRWAVSIPSDRLGPPGPGRLRAVTQGTETVSAAAVELAVTRVLEPQLVLKTDPDPPRAGQNVRVEGYLGGPRGGLARKAVGFFDGETHLGTRLTEADGTFTQNFPLAADVRSLRAEFTSDTPGMGDARTAAMGVRPPRAIPLVYKVVPTLVLLLLFGTMWWRRDRPATSTRRDTQAPPPRLLQPPRGGPRRWVIALTVRDHESGGPLPGATARLERDGQVVLEGLSDDQGVLTMDTEPHVRGGDGALVLRVESPAHEAHAHGLTLPHRGEWSGAELRLRGLRQVAWHSLSKVRAVIRGRAVQPDAWTATEVAARVRQREEAAGSEAASLALQVDTLTYGPQPPSATEVQALHEDGEALAARLDASQRRPR